MLQASIINENCRTSSIHATSSTHSQHCNCSGGSVGVSESIMSESMSEPVETSHAEVLTPVETVRIEVTTSVSESVEALRSEVPILTPSVEALEIKVPTFMGSDVQMLGALDALCRFKPRRESMGWIDKFLKNEETEISPPMQAPVIRPFCMLNILQVYQQQ